MTADCIRAATHGPNEPMNHPIRHYRRKVKPDKVKNGNESEFQRSRDRQRGGAKNTRLRPTIQKAWSSPSFLKQKLPFRACVLLLFLLSLISCEAAGPYGTKNGYDNEGGLEPICWDSQVSWEDARVPPNTTQQLDDNFDIMNAKLFANDSDTDDVDVKLRRSCYSDMNLTVTPNVKNFNGQLMTGVEYSFRLDLRFIPSAVDENAFLAANTNKTTWMRLLLCDAIRTGFCSPYVEQGDISTSEETDLEGPIINEKTGQVDRYGYQEDRTLVAVTDGLHLFSRFVRLGLNETEPGVYDASINVSFVVPVGKGGFFFFLGHAIVYFDVLNNTTPYQFRVSKVASAPCAVESTGMRMLLITVIWLRMTCCCGDHRNGDETQTLGAFRACFSHPVSFPFIVD